ncbi:guanylate-binding protein 6-like isoform X1 [Arvicola amphibius]|uniref:guanylate-binding protein 6-like isoform X1 n=1 Tax=Arvicola amphibius TaxID=1047088 RepID=UPI0018E33321|nr:guanylate-binding protein 6-like isoform X1 [Arvicola amphibius]
MARPQMMAPICLVENHKDQLSVNQTAIDILNNISQPVIVVAIVGLYRTGKSYLMNHLAGQNYGFPLDSTVQSETKGIWMWCVPHLTEPNHTLVLLDTEGLGNMEKGDPKNDSWIFALAVLLSSVFVYNGVGTINHQALEQLHYITELTELIRAKSSASPDGIKNSTEFVSFFPDFVWAVRDFTLELQIDGKSITEDEYLENALKLIPGDNPRIQASNLSRECIRLFFPKRKCFVFDRPTHDKTLLHKLDTVSEEQLDPMFLKQTNAFVSYIFTHAKCKMLREGIKVTGNRLGTLLTTYVDAINSGAVPCLDDAATTLAQRENSAAVQKAAEHYSEQMGQRLRLPTDTLQELLGVHTACEKEAIAVFMEHSFKDENQQFQKKLLKLIDETKRMFMLKYEEASVQYCQKKLNLLSKAFVGDSKNDSWIFALAVLLSSTFVYNSMGTINHQALQQLHYITELTELIRAKSSASPDGIKNSTEFVSFFPDFVWAVWDFMLELKLDGKSITEDEYLENALKLIPGDNPRIQASNLSRECIRLFFPKRKCFVFDRPTHDKTLLHKLDTVSEEQLDPMLLEQTNAFVSYIFTHAKSKMLREGIKVTGNRLGTLVTTYVNAINSGAVPCLDDAVTTLAQRENSAAVQKAAEHYSEQMDQRLRLPTDTLQELLGVHTACEKEAIAVFMEHSFKDENQQFQKKLLELIDEKKRMFILKNEEASDQYCQEELNQLSQSLTENISTFSVPGGHRLYMEMREKIEHDYWQVPRKGVKASEVFQSFLQSQATIESSILQADTALTAGEKTIAEERAQREAAEKEQELLRQKQEEQQQLIEAQEKSHKENLEQLKMKLMQEREQLIKDHTIMLESQQQHQKALLEEGFKKKSEEMSREIQRLTSTVNDMEENNGSFIDRILKEFVTRIAAPVLLPVMAVKRIISAFK